MARLACAEASISARLGILPSPDLSSKVLDRKDLSSDLFCKVFILCGFTSRYCK